jgi:hypothetical protein
LLRPGRRVRANAHDLHDPGQRHCLKTPVSCFRGSGIRHLDPAP